MKRIAAFALSVALICGCASRQNSASMSPSPTAEQIESIRNAYRVSFPNARVGVVSAVLGDQPFAFVSQIDTGVVQEGQIVTFLDAEQTVLTNGSVVKVEPEGLTVRFEPGKRAPRVGDAAVKF
ncbi:MAG TPA: hypothetical protein VF595_16620 [Tepidisphaeraceae bacterium]|jgi:hypothetical protein